MEILLCVHAISVVCSCKFSCASMKILLCVHVNSTVRPCKWVAKTKKYSAGQFLTNSEQKLLNMIPKSFLNFSWSNIFAISRLDLMGVIRHLKKKNSKKWHRQTDGHRNLETESAQWANSMKRLSIYKVFPPLLIDICWFEKRTTLKRIQIILAPW